MPAKASAQSTKRCSIGSSFLPVLVLEDDLGPAHADLEALAPEHLDQDDELEFAAAPDDEAAAGLRFLDLDGHVLEGLLAQALEELDRLDVLALLPGERRGVDEEAHGDGRLVDDDARQGLGRVARADGVADVHVLDAGEDDDVARFGAVGLDELEARRRSAAWRR